MAQQLFFRYVENLSNLVRGAPRYSRKELAHVASYFWNNLTPEVKADWKERARSLRREDPCRRRMSGFWHFTLTLETAMHSFDWDFFAYVWSCVRPEFYGRFDDYIEQAMISELENTIL